MNVRLLITGIASYLSVAALMSSAPTPAAAQMVLRPAAGIQTILFAPGAPARAPISPGNDADLPFGGGLASANNALRLSLEIIPDLEGILRFPVVFEYYEFDGKTTFAVPSQSDRRVQQLRLRYTARMFSFGAGATASFFNGPSLYFSGEARVNHIPKTLLTSRLFYLDTGELIVPERSIRPDPEGQTRIGGVFRIGTQLDFFDPVLIDVNIGVGAINLFGKNTDPATPHILTAEPTVLSEEETLSFGTLGLAVIWAF